jgi:rhodanese-related sulfurtransferase
MDTTDKILAQAKERAQAQGLPYEGALLPAEAHALLQNQPGAKLIDVRTRAEWEWVGRIPGALLIEWNTWPGGQPNAAFLDQLRAEVPAADTPVLFVCRSGARSHNAASAAARAGYAHSFNVLQGFEGDKNDKGQRNSVGGWRAAGLPWSQS